MFAKLSVPCSPNQSKPPPTRQKQVYPFSHKLLLVEINTEGTEAVEVDNITGRGNGTASNLASADTGQVRPAELGAAPDAGVEASKL